MSGKTIVVLATLDTKGREAEYLRGCIERRGHRALLVDTGVVGTPAAAADVPREEVAAAGGRPLAELLERPTREAAAPVMAAGATKVIAALVAQGRAHAVLSLGGTQGTTLSTAVMRALPYGFPKVMVSTMASGNVAPWVDTKDITMMFSVTDIMGLNPFMRKILANAAAAACGMAEAEQGASLERGGRPLVGVTTVGITTQGAMKAVEVLEREGFEAIVFHAVGTGGRAMEEMMRQGLIGAVLDFSIIEVSNEMHAALLAGGPARLTTAGRLGLPQVICPGAVEVLVFNEPHTVPPKFQGRTLVRHSPKITDVRLDRDEMASVGREVARRLGSTAGDAVFLIPAGGYDSYAVAGGPFHDPEADAAFVRELSAHLPPGVRLIERSTDINDPAFATEAAETLASLIRARREP
ncbi:MAG: Tm-1-like ATP-binding domain-containing protein [Planctomycetes bacterium]|nr:Tm-1-like ATP-binding domain-containing protein [Planctomycetota bacterium]